MPSAPLPKLPPGADVVFRRLFDDENDARLLISLLNAILRYEQGSLIRSLTLRPTHLTGPRAADKEVILDIRAEAQDGSHFHVEVQVSVKPAYAERILFYWSELYCGQLEAGQGYSDLCPVISVHFLFFELLARQAHPAYHHVFRARADGDGAVLSPHFELHTLEMPKFADLAEGDLEKKWLYFLKRGHELTAEQVVALGVPEIAEAERKLAMISQNRDLRVQYERRMKAERDAVALTRDSMNQGLSEGRAQGRRRRLVEGKRLGIDEGANLGQQAARQGGKGHDAAPVVSR